MSDGEGRELLISCGAALFTMRTTLRCEGYEPIVTILPDPDRPSLLATVKAGSETAADEETWVLGGEIERRRTHRAGFAGPMVPSRLVDSLVRAAREEGVKLTVVDLPAAVEVIAVLNAGRAGRAGPGPAVQPGNDPLEPATGQRTEGRSARRGVPESGRTHGSGARSGAHARPTHAVSVVGPAVQGRSPLHNGALLR